MYPVTQDSTILNGITEVLQRILKMTSVTSTINKNNAGFFI